MAGIFEDLKRDWDHAEHAVAIRLPHGGWFDRREHPYATQAPAALPVNVDTTTTTEDQVSLSSIASDIKDAVENGDQWLKQIAENHLPAVVALAQRYESDPIVQALEGVELPPEDIAMIVSVINRLAARTAPAQQPAAA